jgi:hypothetical protein
MDTATPPPLRIEHQTTKNERTFGAGKRGIVRGVSTVRRNIP